MASLMEMLNEIGIAAHRSEAGRRYARLHGVRSEANLTVTSDEIAGLMTSYLADRIRDKTVIDVGGGPALLGMHMASIAKAAFVIEANPIWSLAHLELFTRKPANLSFCFGGADQFVGTIKGDVAIVCTNSDVAGMMKIAGSFADITVDVIGELVKGNPEAFDEWARTAREAS